MPYDNTNRVAVWKNDRRKKKEDPQFTGSATVECPHCKNVTDYWANAWRGNPDNHKSPVLSVSLKAKDAPRQAQAPGRPEVEFEDDIPF